jgi:poly-gamma-glutamate system protein
MYKPSLRSIWSILGLGVLATGLYYFAASRYQTVKDEQKLEASRLMSRMTDVIREETVRRNYVIDRENDPNSTGLIGVDRKQSTITTSKGDLSQRLTALNPNLAAVMVDMLREAHIQSGDYVAVGLTGSNPGANLAVYAAMKTMNLKPVIISSVGSAEYGANRDSLTWLDMEKLLVEAKLIDFHTRFASLGGYKDRGGGLDSLGRENIRKAMVRNGLDPQMLWAEKKDKLDGIVRLRMEAYQGALPRNPGAKKNQEYTAFINIGAGYANVGDLLNAVIIDDGVNRKIAERQFQNPGVVMKFAQRAPVIHVHDILNIAAKYDLPIDPEPIPEVGSGKIFERRTLNLTVSIISMLIILIALALVVIFDRQDRHYRSHIVDPAEDL